MSGTPITHAGALVAALVIVAGAASRSDARPREDCPIAGARPTLTAHLLLGARRGTGGLVGEAAWRRFLDRHITPRFPSGLTVFAARGQWRFPDGRVLREPTRVVLIVVEETTEALESLEAIRQAYRETFAQDAAGLVLNRSCAAF